MAHYHAVRQAGLGVSLKFEQTKIHYRKLRSEVGVVVWDGQLVSNVLSEAVLAKDALVFAAQLDIFAYWQADFLRARLFAE